MDEMITRAEHEEFRRGVEAENQRQNHRLTELERTVEQIHALTVSVERLAASVERMVKEQERQGQRLEALEGRDGERWRKVIGYIVAAFFSALATFFFTRII